MDNLRVCPLSNFCSSCYGLEKNEIDYEIYIVLLQSDLISHDSLVLQCVEFFLSTNIDQNAALEHKPTFHLLIIIGCNYRQVNGTL